jgi:hypothetical protein
MLFDFLLQIWLSVCQHQTIDFFQSRILLFVLGTWKTSKTVVSSMFPCRFYTFRTFPYVQPAFYCRQNEHSRTFLSSTVLRLWRDTNGVCKLYATYGVPSL